MHEETEKRYKLTQGNVEEGGLYAVLFAKSMDEAKAKFKERFGDKVKEGVRIDVETFKD